jgi:hypothetical protein
MNIFPIRYLTNCCVVRDLNLNPSRYAPRFSRFKLGLRLGSFEVLQASSRMLTKFAKDAKLHVIVSVASHLFKNSRRENEFAIVYGCRCVET